MAVSLKDISERTHINICSISWVLNNHPRAEKLRPETRAKILLAARELGYCKNEMAASMACRHSNLLVFLTGEVGSIEYTGRIQNGILSTAAARGYTILVLRLQGMTPESVLQKILGWRAAGVIFHVADLSTVAPLTRQLDSHSIPWGTVNLSNPGGLGVTSDDASGLFQAVALLHRRRHRRLCYLSAGNSHYEYQHNRLNGFLRGIQQFYPDQAPLVYTFQPGYTCGDLNQSRQFFQFRRRECIDGVICEQDFIGSSLCLAALKFGISIPEEFSITGFGDTVLAGNSLPGLASIAQDFETMGNHAASLIIDRIENKKIPENPNILLPVTFIERESIR